MRRLQLTPELEGLFWESQPADLLVLCLSGHVTPDFILEFARKPFDFYVRHPRRLVDMRHSDLSLVMPQAAGDAAARLERAADVNQHTVLLLPAGFAYGLGRAYQAYSAMRGRRVDVCHSLEEAEEILHTDLSWYPESLVSQLSPITREVGAT